MGVAVGLGVSVAAGVGMGVSVGTDVALGAEVAAGSAVFVGTVVAVASDPWVGCEVTAGVWPPAVVGLAPVAAGVAGDTFVPVVNATRGTVGVLEGPNGAAVLAPTGVKVGLGVRVGADVAAGCCAQPATTRVTANQTANAALLRTGQFLRSTCTSLPYKRPGRIALMKFVDLLRRLCTRLAAANGLALYTT